MSHSSLSRRSFLRTASLGALGSVSLAPRSEAAPPPAPQREFRAAWMASVFNLDWPSRAGADPGTQKAELARQLDEAARLRLNAVIFQVRPSGDALYASSLEPWSGFVSGRAGASPGYDPLAVAITEARRRGLELHAWFNPFRAVASAKYGAVGNHFGAKHPQWMKSFAGGKWFDPGEPAVREHVVRVIMDVVRRYRVDGVHIDDYFYPYPPSGTPGLGTSAFPDGDSYARHGGGQNRAAWRRSNVDAFVSQMYRAVKSVKPGVKVGISPFGIWRPGVPAGITGKLDSYEYLGADARGWIARGWCDYLSPQLYWRIDPPDQSFTALLKWWHQQNRSGRHIWPGMAVDRIQSSTDPGRPASEIIRQIEASRRMAPAGRAGHAHWALKNLRQNRGGIQGALLNGPYLTKALVPASPWLGAAVPATPRAVCSGGEIHAQPVGDDAAWITVQSRRGGAWTLDHVLPADEMPPVAWADGAELAAVRAISAAGVESEPALVEPPRV